MTENKSQIEKLEDLTDELDDSTDELDGLTPYQRIQYEEQPRTVENIEKVLISWVSEYIGDEYVRGDIAVSISDLAEILQYNFYDEEDSDEK